MQESYFTIKEYSTGIYKEKGSKFIAHAYPIRNIDEIKEHLKNIKAEFFDARHICYAYHWGYNKEVVRTNDDGEPSGTAGKPIQGQLLSFNLTNILIVVVRYFGGTKLGVSGLIAAYKQAAKDAIGNNEIIEKAITEHYIIHFAYVQMNNIMRILKETEIPIITSNFALTCTIEIHLENKKKYTFLSKIEKIDDVTYEVLPE